jgi:hypothetical protein
MEPIIWHTTDITVRQYKKTYVIGEEHFQTEILGHATV